MRDGVGLLADEGPRVRPIWPYRYRYGQTDIQQTDTDTYTPFQNLYQTDTDTDMIIC